MIKETLSIGDTGTQLVSKFNGNFNRLQENFKITVYSSESGLVGYDNLCDGTDDQVQINAAIDIATAFTNGGTVYLSDGLYNISDSIVIKDNVRLILSDSAKIWLVDDSDKFMLRGVATGSSNFTVKGGRWFGNRDNQTRHYIDYNVIGDNYYGMGFIFFLCEDFYVGDLYIEDSNSWAICHWNCTNFTFKNIRIWQTGTHPTNPNQDGISGLGAINMTIENISGHTGDEFIGLGARQGTAAQGWNYTYRGCSNIHIRNIHGEVGPGGFYPLSMIGLYMQEEQTMEDVYIQNISGGISYTIAAIHILNYAPSTTGKGYYKNINIDNINIERTTTDESVVEFGGRANLIVSTFDDMIVYDANLSNIRLKNSHDSQEIIIRLNNVVSKINIHNVSAINETGTNKHKLVNVNGNGQANNINISGIDLTSDITPIVENTGTSTNLRINALECYPDVIAQVNASVIGDRMVEKTTFHPMLFTTKWIDVIDGSDI